MEEQFKDVLRDAADERNLSDYHASTDSYERGDVAEFLADARAFVERMERLLDD